MRKNFTPTENEVSGRPYEFCFYEESGKFDIERWNEQYGGRRQEQYEFSAKVAGYCILAALIIIITVILI